MDKNKEIFRLEGMLQEATESALIIAEMLNKAINSHNQDLELMKKMNEKIINQKNHIEELEICIERRKESFRKLSLVSYNRRMEIKKLKKNQRHS